MRYSKLFGKSRYDAPCDADSINAKFLTQAGFIEKLSAGVYSFLPLGFRVLDKIKNIIRKEMDSVDSQELLMPALHPISLYETTKRDKTMEDIFYKTKGAGGSDFVFGSTHEETATPLAQVFLNSYRDLPLSFYQIQNKFRNEPRAKSGLLRGREFGMKDMYSFHANLEDLDRYYDTVIEAYKRVYKKCGVHAYVIQASGGIFSKEMSHEFSVPTDAGEDTIILCKGCDLAQNLEIATGKVVDIEGSADPELPLKMVEADHGPEVSSNAKFHAVSDSQILKTVVYQVEDSELVGVCIRGDLKVNEIKLAAYFDKKIRPATREALIEVGLVPGFISPVNIDENIGLAFIADHSIKNVKNFVTGANLKNMDFVNANIGRDFIIDDFVDLVEVREGFACLNCGGEVTEITAIEAGNIFKLGTKYTDAFGFTFTDSDGVRKPVVMASYGLGTTRLMGTIVEASHDDKGIIWPKSVAPFHVHLIVLGNDADVLKSADDIYHDLLDKGIEVLFDDRDERAGVKFTNADLIGIPVRVIVSKKTLEAKSVEWKLRNSEDTMLVELDSLVEKIRTYLK